MSETGKLQKAIEITIAAGYQLNKEAFEFLTTLASTLDPTEIVIKAIHEIEALKEKPLFIDRDFLEKLVQPL
jgi:wyosine [tRNA(Phe)-imidazoG37] synthetase (radical SAM superfamily)